MSAALIGSGVGLSLGAAYLAGGMAQHAADHNRVARIAQAAAGGYAASVLEQKQDALAPAVLRVVHEQDAFALTRRDRQTPGVAGRLERDAPTLAQKRARELECLTQAVYYEARGEGVRGQQAVAQVVMNRVRHRAFPKTVCGVVFQGAGRKVGCQFSFACDGSMRRAREQGAWKRAQRVASRALAGAALAEIGSATHFHTTAVSPAWGPQMRQVAQVGMHVFYKFGPRRKAPAQAAPAVVEQAVMTSAAAGPPTELRLTSAVVDKAAESVVLTPPPAVEAPAVAVKAPPLAVPAKPAAAKPAPAKAAPAPAPSESAGLQTTATAES